MNWISIVAMILTGIGIIISVIALIQARKANKAVLQQNKERELAQIEQELANIEIKITQIESKPRKIYDVVHGMDSDRQMLITLEKKKNALLQRKHKIEQQ